jgi:D-glycero-D-manno-heptose 1,7-bisphosphate phosphatase
VKRAVFLDRDGVINAAPYNAEEGKYDSPYTLADFRFLPGAKQAIRLLNQKGWLTVVVSNQPGIAKRKCSAPFLEALNERMRTGLAASGAHLDAIYYCLHHPQALVSELRETCRCRKPRPGLLLTAACDLQVDLATSYMVGDGMQDVEAALAAGCKPILIRRPRSLEMKLPTVNGSRVATSLLAAVKQILSEEGEP